MWGFCTGTIRSCTVNTFYFYFSFVFLRSLWNFGLYLFFDLVDLTSLRGFALNFYLIPLFETTGLVLTFVNVAPLTFKNLPSVLTVGVTRKISDPNKLYSKISQTPPLSIILSPVLKKLIFKWKKTNPKRIWCLNLLQPALCIWSLQSSGSFFCCA